MILQHYVPLFSTIISVINLCIFVCLFDSLLIPTLDYKFMRTGTRFKFSVFFKNHYYLLSTQHIAWYIEAIQLILFVQFVNLETFTSPCLLLRIHHISLPFFSHYTQVIPSQSDHEPSNTLWHSGFLLNSNSLTAIILLQFPSACSLLFLLLALLQ